MLFANDIALINEIGGATKKLGNEGLLCSLQFKDFRISGSEMYDKDCEFNEEVGETASELAMGNVTIDYNSEG